MRSTIRRSRRSGRVSEASDEVRRDTGPTRSQDFWSRVRWNAVLAVPFAAGGAALQTSGGAHVTYFVRALVVWMAFSIVTALVESLLRPQSRAGWSRFVAAALCGAADGLFSAQWLQLSLGDASPIRITGRLTVLWILGVAWIRAMASIDWTDPPRFRRIAAVGQGERVAEPASVPRA